MSKELRIGIIGSGGIVGRHVEAFQHVPDTRISGYFSPSQPDRPESWGRKFPDVDAVMAESDAVLVCVPPNQHGVELYLAENDFPFAVEKPLSTRRRLPRTVSALVAARELPTAVAYQWRASQISKEAKDQLRNTEVKHATLKYLDPAWSYVPDWFLDLDRSGGPVVEQATHVLDEARYLLGDFSVLAAQESFDMPTAYLDIRPGLANATIPTKVSADIRFASGVLGTFESSIIEPGAEDRRVEIEMKCADGSTLIVARDKITRDGEVLFELPNFTQVSTIEQNRAFAESVRTGEPTPYATYPEGEETHERVMDIVDLAQESSTKAA
jgi:predicted dehydrogenase